MGAPRRPGTTFAMLDPMHPWSGIVSHVGARRRNEDAWVDAPELGLFAVADGMGGHAGGALASRLAAEALLTTFRSQRRDLGPEALGARLETGFRVAEVQVRRRRVAELARMGTTLAALALEAGVGVVAHVGDSRVYRCRGGVVEALTRDHSYVEQMRAAGMAPARHLRHLITRAVGSDRGPPELRRVDARAGDTFLLCTDGLSDVLGAGHIRRVLARTYAPERSAEALVHEALRRGTQDNVTALVVRID